LNRMVVFLSLMIPLLPYKPTHAASFFKSPSAPFAD
jgi:hypothetical protein